ncbi:hypothetical protein OAS45_02740 [Polaribacter sp.]|nr:hypothetical protein [Polaribacter sp.]MDC1374801.1 hypothetical protein [Polaribacter sp.]
MKYCIQVLAPSFMHVNIYPLEEDNYQKAIEFVKLHGHAPFIHDLTYFDTAPADYNVVRHHQDIKIKILDENDIVLSEFKLFETTGFNLDGRTYNNKYFWEKHSKNKPCLIDRRYNNDMDLESEVIWEHEIEAENVPKKKDFEYTISTFEDRDEDGNWLEESKSILYKNNPLMVTYYPMVAADGHNYGNLDCFLLDSTGKILKDYYGVY